LACAKVFAANNRQAAEKANTMFFFINDDFFGKRKGIIKISYKPRVCING